MESNCQKKVDNGSKTVTATYEDICEELDNALLKLFGLLDTLMEERMKLHDFMKLGFVDMAKARYSLGNHRVSSLQLNMKEMSASKHVIVEKSVSARYSFTSYAIVNTNRVHDEDSAVKMEDGIRKRIPRTKSSDSDINELSSRTENLDISDSSEEMTIKNKMTNPLNWFGVLTPQSLRNCQKYFQQSIDSTAVVASIQSEIKALFNYIDHLKAEKLLLQQQN